MTHRSMLRYASPLLVALLFVGCASDDNPPCRRVSAQEFVRPHTFKGMASDQFIGVSSSPSHFTPMKGDAKAFKTIWEFGINHGWAVIWCPVEELPADYLRTARTKPNRKTTTDGFTHE